VGRATIKNGDEMTVIDLDTRRGLLELQRVETIASDAAQILIGDLSIFDWYAEATIDANVYMDGNLVQLHMHINKEVFKLIIDSDGLGDYWQLRPQYDDIGDSTYFKLSALTSQKLVHAFHRFNRPALGKLWLSLV